MSEPKMISPLLDGFVMGSPISSHNGIVCCPAIYMNTGEQYIVKIISIPASQVQLAALLLSGAYKDRAAASEYFLELTKDIVREKGWLSDLSRLEGFCAYTDCQVVPMEDGIGYDVYLLSPFRQSLEALLAENKLTNLGAVNMGLDLCAALAASRRAGYLYVDLKPSNIFAVQAHEFRIGDLGFAPLSSLKFATLPEKYHSPYTAPEVLDAMAVLNDTVDIYALGLVLYQAYNGGALPETSEADFEPPMYADYEMSEIILKACSSDPAQRWQDPVQMGQALVGYMQRNEVNDTPIIPAPVEEPEIAEPEEAVEAEEFLPDEELNQDELDFIAALHEEEAALAALEPAETEGNPLQEDAAEILAQADALIAHELPQPVIAPTLKPVPVPEIVRDISDPEVADIPTEEEFFAEVAAEEQEAAQTAAPVNAPIKRSPLLLIIGIVLAAVLVAGAAFGIWYYYQNIYLQTIDKLTVQGTEDMLTVQVASTIDESLLTVICTDSYGNSRFTSVSAGVAVFHDLNPQTRYNIRVEISGNHKLTGQTTASYTTATLTNILSFNAVIGPEDGSVLLSFTVEGKEPNSWVITYETAGISPEKVAFSGHSITLKDLIVGANYTFILSSEEDIYLAGHTDVRFTPSSVVFAEDLSIPFCGNGVLTVAWTEPAGVEVPYWVVRCYNESGYNETVNVTDTTYTFTDIDHNSDYTVEVFAAGMNQCVYTTIAANPVLINAFHFDATDPQNLRLTWDFTGKTPAGGWLIEYTINGIRYEMACNDTLALLVSVPGGQYTLCLKAADGTPVFGGSASYDYPAAQEPDLPETPEAPDTTA